MWPSCAGCGRPMSFLAQFAHDPDRLDLGGAGRLLTMWQCGREERVGWCETWDPTGGANAVLVVAQAASSCPLPADPPDLVAVRPIVGWAEREDGVAAEDAPAYMDRDRYWALTGQPDAVYGSRLGGVPTWIQDVAAKPGWVFVGQFEDGMDVHGQPNPDGGVSGPNFGTGCAYAFLDRSVDPPAGFMLWQC